MSNIIVSPVSGIIEFNTGDPSGAAFHTSTAPIRLDATGGDSWFTGTNVGIGTTSPEVQLHVKAADGVTGVLKIEGGKSAVTAVGEINSEIQFGANDPSIGQDNIGGKISSVTEYNNGAFAGLAFYTYYQTTSDLAEHMRLSYKGYLGIGVTEPATPLHVYSADNRVATFQSSDNDILIALGDDYDTVYMGHDAALNVMSLGFDSSMGVSANVNIDTAGAVGIGTNNPLAPLHIKSSTSNSKIRMTNDSSRNWAFMVGNAGYYQGNFMIHDGDAGERFAIDSAGKVGIGTNSPSYTLDVKGDRILLDRGGTNDAVIEARTSTAGAYFIANSLGTGNYAGLQIQGAGADNWFVGQYGYADFRILDGSRSGGTTALTIQNSTQNVGIGTTNPTETLDVVGDGKFSGQVTIPLTPVAATDAASKDYVDTTAAGAVRFTRDGINSSTYTMLCTVAGDRLASIIKMTITGTSNSVVIACSFEITVNHYQDIHIRSANGDYKEATIRITSNNDEDYSIELKHNGSTTTQVEVYVFPQAGETITPTTTDPNYTGAEYEHTAIEGWRFGGEDNDSESSNVVVDGKIGIGTTAPNRLLHISNDTATVTNNSQLRIDNAGAGDAYIYMYAGTDWSMGVDNSDDDAFKICLGNDVSDGTEIITIETDGKVGIGTNAPARKLEVSENSSSIVSQFKSTAGTSAYITLANTTSTADKVRVGSVGNDLILSSNYTDPDIYIKAGGSVGIGTTAPAATLDILGDNSSNAFNIIQGGEAAFRFSTYIEPTSTNTPVFRQGIYYNATENATIAYCRGGSSVGGFLTFQTDTGAERMRIGSDGNVGIGTTNPTQKLDVACDEEVSAVIGHAHIGAVGHAGYAGFSHINLDSASNYALLQSAGGHTYLNAASSYAIHFRINNSDVGGFNNGGDFFVNTSNIFVDSSQNTVGIGTTSMSSLARMTIQAQNANAIQTGLVINSYQNTTGTAGNGVGIVMGQNNGTYASKIANIWTNNNPSYLQTNIAFYTMHDSYAAGSETEKMRLTSQGRLGIGVTNPTQRLEVTPDTDVSAIIGKAHVGYMGQADSASFSHVDYDTTSNYALKQNSVGNTMLNVKAGGSIGFNIANTTVAAINNGGDFFVDTDTLFVDASTDRVGIGTNTPLDLLHIKSSSDDARLLLDGHTNYDAELKFAEAGSVKYTVGHDAASDNFVIGTANVDTNPRLVIDSAGLVGIGTTNPLAKLDVRGIISGYGNFLGTGLGSRITAADGKPYLVSGDSPAETQTLQDVTDNGATTTNLVNLNNGVKIGSRIYEKALGLIHFTNGVANQKVDLYWTGTQVFWGEISVTITSTYSHQNSVGIVQKKFFVGLNASNSIFTNDSRIVEADGDMPDNFTISDLKWDATNSRYYITIVHRVSTGNSVAVKFEAFAKDTANIDNIDDVTAGSIYTTDTTAYDKPYVYYNDRVGIGTTNPDKFLTIDAGGEYPLKVNSTQDYLMGLARNGTEQWWFKVNSAGDFTIHENAADDRFRIKAGGNVGIGSATPAYKLDVAGDIQAKDAAVIAGMNNHDGYIFHDLGTGWGYKAPTSPSRLAIFTDTAERLTIASDGEVGIGTTTPEDGVCHIYKNATIGAIGTPNKGNAGLHIEDSSNHMYLDGNSILTMGDSWISTSGNYSLAFGTNNTQRVTIEGGGNVGIGTNSPAFTNGGGLEIENGTTATLRLQRVGSHSAELNMGASSFDIRDLSAGHINYYVSNTIKWKMNADGLHSQDIANGISFYGDSNLDHAIVSRNTLGSVADDIRINSYGAVYINLDSNANQTAGADFAIGRHGGAIGTMADTSFFYLNGENGNVGIGTTDPSAQYFNNLVVGNDTAGDKGITIRSNASNKGVLAFSDTDSANAGRYDGYIAYGHTDNTMRFFTNAGNERMTIDNNGKVGIGNTEPADDLQVEGQVRIDGSTTDGLTISSNAGASQGLLIYNNSDTDTASIINYYNGPLVLGQNNTEDMRLDNGCVGIGVTNPAGDKLMVQGDANYFATRLDGSTTAGQSYGLRVRAGYNTTDRPLLIEDGAGADIFEIDGVGNVGVGTNPRVALDVNGEIRNLAKVSRNYRTAMGSTTLYVGTVDLNGNGDGGGFTVKIYEPAEKVWRLAHVTIQNSGGTNYTSVTVEGGGEDTEVHINLIYKNRDGDATKTDFFLDPTATISFTQYVYVEGYIITDTGYNTTSTTDVDLDTDIALYQTDAADGSNVGIGTVNPSKKLHVNGSVLIDTDAGSDALWITRQGNTNESLKIFVDDAHATFESIQDENTAAYGNFYFKTDVDDSTTYYRYDIGGSEKMRLTNSGLGIGTTAPSASLHIFKTEGGVGAKHATLRMGGYLSVGPEIAAYRVDGNSNNQGLIFSTNDATDGLVDVLTMNNDGNVGIGTTNPDAFHTDARRLTVGDGVGSEGITIYAGTSSASSLFFADGAAGDQAYRGYITYSHSAEKLSLGAGGGTQITATNGGDVGIGTNAPDEKLDVEAGNIVITNGQYYIFDGGGAKNHKMRSYWDGSQGHIEMIAGGIDVMDWAADGNVGIGTNSPDTLLHLEGAEPTLRIFDSANTLNQESTIQFGTEPGDRTQAEIASINLNAGNAAGGLIFRTNGGSSLTERIRIDSDGNVGIGTNAPDALLELYEDGGGSSTTLLNVGGTGNGRMLVRHIDGKLHTSDTPHQLYLNYVSSDHISMVNGGGNVGIGSNTPSQKLDVDGTVVAARFIQDTNVGSDFYAITTARSSSGLTSPDIYDYNGNGLVLGGAHNEGTLVVKAGGNVGIGTTAPSARLEVDGEIRAESNMTLGSDGTYGAAYGAIGIGTSSLTNGHHRIFAKSSDDMYLASATSRGIRFRVNGASTDNVIIDNGGRVGIGTNSSLQNSLNVAGGVAIGASYVGYTAPSNGMVIQGNVGIAVSSPSYTLHVGGSIVGTSKSFLIDHPTKEGKQLMHSCLEGPEHGVYFRGKSDLNIIKMPDYWTGLVHMDTMSVDLTAIGPHQNIYVDSIADNGEVTVGSNTEEPLNYFYSVYGERKDVDRLEIEIVNPEYAD